MRATDGHLVAEVLAGNSRQYEELVRRHLPLAYAVAYAQTLNHADAEDTVQETFTNAWRRLDTLQEPGKFAQWLAVIARNCGQSVRRQRGKQRGVTPVAAQVVTPDPAREELHALIQEHLAKLSEERREVLVLYYFTGLNTSEIARKLEISRAAAKKRLQRAREEMGATLVASLAPALEPRRPLDKQARGILSMLGVSFVTRPLPRSDTDSNNASSWAWHAPVAASVSAAIVAVAVWVVMKSSESATYSTPTTPAMVAPVIMAATTDQDQPQEPEHDPQAEAATQAAPTAEPANDDAIKAERLDARVSLTFEYAHLFDVLHHLEQETGLSILYDAAIIAPPGEADRVATPEPVIVEEPFVTDGMIAEVKFEDVPAGEVLQTLLQPMGLAFALEPGRIWISTPAGIREEVPRHAPERFEPYVNRNNLDERYRLLFEEIHLVELLAYVGETYPADFVLDFRVIQPPTKENEESACTPFDAVYSKFVGASPRPTTTGLIPRIELADVALGDALAAMLRPLNLAYSVRDGLVWVSAPALLRTGGYATHEDLHFTPPEAVARKLKQPVSMLFKDIHLFEILGFIVEAYDFDIAVDFRVVDPPCEIGATVEDETGVVITGSYITTGEVPWLQLEQVRLRTALFALLHPLDLDYELEDETLIVSSERRFNAGNVAPVVDPGSWTGR